MNKPTSLDGLLLASLGQLRVKITALSRVTMSVSLLSVSYKENVPGLRFRLVYFLSDGNFLATAATHISTMTVN